MSMIAGAVVRFGTVIIMSPIFGIPGAILCVIGWWMGQLFMKAQLAVKRERSNARAPILAHVSAALHGLGKLDPVNTPNYSLTIATVSIRAYGAQAAFRKESFQRIDLYTKATITYNHLTRFANPRSAVARLTDV